MALIENTLSSWWISNEGTRAESSMSQLAKSPRMKNVISGTCGGISLVAVGHPFDTIKVKLQTQSMAGRAPLYSGAIDCMQRTLKMEGLNGLYKGISSPLVGQMFNNACLFVTFDEIKAAMIERNGGSPLTSQQTFVAGGLAGGVVALVESPTDLFKSKMQLQTSSASPIKYNSTLDCVRHVTQLAGIRGWYQGFCGTVLRNMTGNALFFGIYDLMLKKLEPHGERKASSLFIAGSTAGFAFTSVVYPLDTIKSALMADASSPKERQYLGVLDCAKKLYARQGWRAFMQGLSPSLVRATPGCGMLVVTVEGVKRLMERM